MRVLHTAATYAPHLDGVAEVVRNISERLVEQGHEVHVATSAIRSGSSYAQLGGVNVHRFDVRGNLAIGIKGEVERYRDFVRHGNWDLLVNHCLQTWVTDALISEIAAYRWPSILVTHGLSIHNSVFNSYYREIPKYIPAYEKWLCVARRSGESTLARKFGLPLPIFITNGVDLNEWTRAPLRLRDRWGVGHKLWIVNVSNHSSLKGHREFFRLATRLRTSNKQTTLVGGTYPMSKWTLGRFGIRGGCAYECGLRSIVSRGEVDLKMNLPREEVVSAIREADLVVSTSHREANSVVLLESMAAGVPWVSFDVGSSRENAGGVVVGDLNEMVNAVDELLRSPDCRRALGDIGRARIVTSHDWANIVDQYEQVYSSTVKHHGLTMTASAVQ